MKRLILAAAALAVPMLGVSAAQAASINFGSYKGPITITYGNFDVGRVYSLPNGTTVVGTPAVDALPQTDAASPFVPVVGGGLNPVTGSNNAAEDTWGIAKVTAIYAGTDVLAPLIYQAGNPGLQGNTQVTAFFFGGSDVQVSNSSTGIQTTSTAGVQLGFFASQIGNSGDGADLSSTPSAGDRTNGPVGYPGITDGTLIFSFVGQAGHFLDAPTADQQSTFNPNLVNGGDPSIAIGQGTLFLEKGALNLGSGPMTGTENDVIVPNPLGADAQVQFTTREGTRDWTVTSNDPAQTFVNAAPTPTTASMGALGMAGLLVGSMLRRSRRQSC